MKKNAIVMVLALMMALFVAGCSQSIESEKKHANHSSEILEVEIAIKASPAKVNENVAFEAKVTQGGKPVEDAKEVEFEFAREGDSDTEIIKVNNQENGVYQLEKSFPEEGRYTITTHVTARDMHSMPSEEFEITP